MGWIDRLEALDDAVAVRVHGLMGADTSTQFGYRFDADDCVVLSVPRSRRRVGVAVSIVGVIAIVFFATRVQVNGWVLIPPVVAGSIPSKLGMRVQLDASGVTYRYAWFLPAAYTPWPEVDLVVTGPWPAMRPPYVRRRRLPNRVPLRGRRLQASGGDPVIYAAEMARRHEVPVMDAP